LQNLLPIADAELQLLLQHLLLIVDAELQLLLQRLLLIVDAELLRLLQHLLPIVDVELQRLLPIVDALHLSQLLAVKLLPSHAVKLLLHLAASVSVSKSFALG